MHAQIIKLETEDKDYRVCLNCERHPRYPNIPAVTLHRGMECLICHNDSLPPHPRRDYEAEDEEERETEVRVVFRFRAMCSW